MNFTLRDIVLRAFLLLMAFQTLNLSIDAIDFQPIESSAGLGNFNFINSMTEYVSEIVMGHKDAFPEYDAGHSSKQQLNKHSDIKVYKPASMAFNIRTLSFDDAIDFSFPLNEQYCYLFSKEIIPPPPKA